MDRGFRRRKFLHATGAGLLALGSGCSTLRANSRWSVELGGSPARSRKLADDGFVVASTLESSGELGFVRFSGKHESLAELPRITASPVLDGNRALVEADGVIQKIPLSGGNPTSLGTGYLAFGRYSPIIAGSRLYGVGYSDDIEKYGVFSLDLKTERIEWLHPFGHTRSSADTDGERVFAASPTGMVRAYDATDGTPLWSRKTAGRAALTHHDGTVFVASMGGVSALNPTNGSVRWHTESDWIGSVGTIPEANDSSVYAVFSLYSSHRRTRLAMETYVVAYNRKTGDERWRKRAKFGTPLTVTADAVAFESVERAETSDGKTKSRERLSIFGTGGGRKQQYELSDRVTMKPILRDDVIIVGDGKTIVAHDR
ncbi:PQQ-binding-like beta-propeller repeat protein [Haladaptatus sp. DFWS20]|uniref:outer membrane protein assembly factor BamB family protein n=1 Tax=Haladaptatus sp. DFWS20 TaxID=3403467 RepID=UPI003EC098DA